MTRARAYQIALTSMLVGTFLSSGCDSGGLVKADPAEAPTATSVELDSIPANVAREDTVPLHATVLDENGTPLTGLTVDWTSSDQQVAVVQATSGTGALLFGQDQGTTTITVSYQSLSTSMSVQVHRRPTDLVYVSGSGQTGEAGQELADSLVVRAVDRRGDPVSGVDISFAVVSGGGSVSPTGGTTDANGMLSTAWTLGSGLTQEVQGRASEAQQRVQQLKDSVVVFTASTPMVVVGLAVLPDSPTVSVGDSLQFEAMATTSDGSEVSDGQVTWQTTDTTVATISPKGMLRGRKGGRAGVIARTAQTNGSTVSDTTQVTVASTASTLGTLRVTSPDTLYGIGDTLTLAVEARAADGSVISNPGVQWSSLNSQVATVDSSGKVTARALGTALVTAISLCCSPDTATVVVAAGAAPAQGTLTIVSPDTLRGIGDTLTLNVQARAADGSTIANPDVQWSSLNPQIATVDTMGKVISQALGTAMIVASSVCCSSDTGVVAVVAGSPATVTDLAVAAVSTDSVTLHWTQVDDGTGQPASYVVRYGSPSLSWGSADSTQASVAGTAKGNTLSYTYHGLSPATGYQFQVASYRGTLNSNAVFGELSNQVSATTGSTTTPPPAGDLIFHEDWNNGFGKWDDNNTPTAHSIVADPTGQGRGNVLKVNYASDTDGGWLTHWITPPSTGELDIRTYFYLAPGWGSSDNTKLTIIAGNRSDNLWSSFGQAGVVPNGTDFFQSMTAMGSGVVRDRRMLLYTYYPDQANNYGDEDVGTQVPSIGQWHQLDHFVRINDVGQANGVIRAWLDGQLVYEKTGVEFRTSNILDLNEVMLSFNGTGLTGNTMYYDDVYVYDAQPSDLSDGGSTALSAGTIAANAADGSVTVSQTTAPSGGSGTYSVQLYRSTTQGQKGVAVAGATSLPFTDNSVTNGTMYYYTLQVTDVAADSGDSPQVGAMPQAPGTGTFAAPDILDHSFANGLGSWDLLVGANAISLVTDPTGFFGGRQVAKFAYKVNSSSHADQEIWPAVQGTGAQEVYAAMDFVISGIQGATGAQRKLIYFKGDRDYSGYGTSWVVILKTYLPGLELGLDNHKTDGTAGIGNNLIVANHPYRVELGVRVNDPGQSNGFIKVWLTDLSAGPSSRKLVYSNTSAVIDATAAGTWDGTADQIQFGTQLDNGGYEGTLVADNRIIDRVMVSTKQIGTYGLQ